MGIATEKLGIYDELQSKGLRYLPPLRLVKADDIPRSAIEEAARKAVDEAIAEAIQRALDRRREEIDKLVAPCGPEVARVFEAVAEASGIPVAELMGKSRINIVGRARWLFWYITAALRRDLSLPVLGDIMGGKDHTSVLHGLRRFPSVRDEAPLRDYCRHHAIAELLAAADDNPRRV